MLEFTRFLHPIGSVLNYLLVGLACCGCLGSFVAFSGYLTGLLPSLVAGLLCWVFWTMLRCRKHARGKMLGKAK